MASVLILSSLNRNFPSDVDKILRATDYDSHRYESLQSFLASPLRARPFVAVFEIGTTEDLDRAVIAKEWIEHMQPAASVKVIAVFSNKNVNTGDKKNKFPIADILHFPITAKNLIFKLDLHLGLLDKEAAAEKEGKKKPRKGFTLSGAADKITTKERVIVLLGPSEHEGRWNGESETPTGKTRWRWIKNQQQPAGQPEDSFEKEIAWVAESKSLPHYNQKTTAWELDDPDAELICLKKGVVVFSTNEKTVKKAGEPLDGPRVAAKQSPPETSAAALQKNTPFTTPPSTKTIEQKTANPGNSQDSQTTQKISANTASGGDTATEQQKKPELQTPPAEETRFVKTNPNIIIPTAIQSGAQIKTDRVDNLKKEAKNTSPQTQANEEKSNNTIKAARTTSEKKAIITPDKPPQPAADPLKNQPLADSAQTTAGAAEPKINVQLEEGYAGGINDKTGGKSLTTKHEVPREEASRKTYINQTQTDKTHLKTMESRVATNNSFADLETRKKNEPQDSGAKSAQTSIKTPEPDPAASQKNRALLDEIKFAKKDKSETAQAQALADSRLSEKQNIREEAIQKPPPQSTQSPNGENPSSPNNPSTPQAVSPGESFPLEKIRFAPTPHSEEAQNIISAGKTSQEEASVLANKRQNETEDPENYLKKRHFVLMTLEQLHDKNSSWHPIDAARIYLSAHHRYYGIKKIEEIFPLWIYEGELAPEFLERQKSWKFYDRPPNHYISMATVPSYLAEPLKRLVGLSAETGKNPQQMRWVNSPQPSESETALLGEAEKNPQIAQKKKKLLFGLLEWISKLFGS